MSILFRLGDAQLAHPRLAGDFAENFPDLARRIGDRNFEGLVVLRHGRVSRELDARLRGNSLKSSSSQRAGQLARAIGAEVKKDHAVAVADQSFGTDIVNHRRQNEFVGHLFFVTVANRLQS